MPVPMLLMDGFRSPKQSKEDTFTPSGTTVAGKLTIDDRTTTIMESIIKPQPPTPAGLDTIHKVTPTPHNFRTLNPNDDTDGKETRNSIERVVSQQRDNDA